jgi:hypothetical protein
MALELTTVGAYVAYAVESTAGTRPTTGFTQIPNITTAPEIGLSTNALDASDLADLITRYVPGRQDPGGAVQFEANNTDAFQTAWGALKTAADAAYATGKQTWFAYVLPNAANSFYFSAIPQQLGTGALDGDAVHTVSPEVIVTGVAGWATKPTVA